MATTIFLVNPREGAVTPPSYLLDTYSATAAYSLRQLKTGVTNVVRVRRSSDNRESDFTATEITDGTLTGFCGGGDGFVTTWYDQSGSGNTITQSTAGNQPRLVASGVVQVFGNGYGVNFNVAAGLQYLSLGSGLSALSSEPFTWFAPTKGTSTGVYSVIFNTGSGATANSRFQTYLAVKSSGTVSTLTKNTSGTSYSIAPTALTASQEYLRSQVVDSSKGIEDFVDGSSIGTVTFTGSYVNDVFQVGANTNLSQECTGVIPELIIFGTDESANRTDIETDINGYYSIY